MQISHSTSTHSQKWCSSHFALHSSPSCRQILSAGLWRIQHPLLRLYCVAPSLRSRHLNGLFKMLKVHLTTPHEFMCWAHLSLVVHHAILRILRCTQMSNFLTKFCLPLTFNDLNKVNCCRQTAQIRFTCI